MRIFFLLLIALFLSVGFSLPLKVVRIAVIDTGIDLEDPRFKGYICDYEDFTGTGIIDNEGHGTHILGLIKQYAKDKNYCFIILKFFNDYNTSSIQNKLNLMKAYKSLYKYNPDIVNLSGGGAGFMEDEDLTIKDLKNVQFFVAAGNDNKNIDLYPYYPASLNYINVTPVGALGRDGKKLDSSNWGKRVIWEIGENIYSTIPFGSMGFKSGTSMSTAIITGKYVYTHY